MTLCYSRRFTCVLLLLLSVFCLAADAADKRPPATSSPIHQEFLKHSTLAGVFRRHAKKLLVNREKAKVIVKGLKDVVHLDEIVVFCLLAWMSKPAVRLPYEALSSGRQKDKAPRNFEETPLHLIFDHLSQLAKLALAIYAVDVLKIIAQGMGFKLANMGDFNHAFGKILYTGWIANRASALKRYILAKQTNQDYRDLDGQVQIVDRLIDAALYGITLYIAVDTVQTNMDATMRGFLAFGSVSALAMSLAMQGFVTQVFHGLFLAGSNRVNEGDSVEVLGMSGKIEDLGWLETTLRMSDNILVSIPNADLAGQRISNLSRAITSQVSQKLTFENSEDSLEQIPLLLKDIKREVGISCPTLITDGSRPCRVHVTSIEGDLIEVSCKLHFRIKPVGDAYLDNRQEAIFAIARAVRRSPLQPASPLM
ncbi:MscS family protein [Seminavis robusta]|uniref:MscS family protein n=1 Tax=Seminavis robusta TaxID=568900 RepID=A0A9N8HCU2_9STRA|nr:MscS family protein [Seminavis robusta]|eukprot:Sro395_g134090.1 MscS family protein (424) ;mRNA; f:42324-43754